jgi:hypothetical protein
MTTDFIGVNIKIEVQQTIGSPVTVQSITLADPGVIGATGHGYLNGDVVVFSVTDGMVEIDRQAVRVANKTTDTFEAEGLDTTTYSIFTAGTVTKVTAFQTLAMAQSVTMPNPSPTKITLTRLIDKVERYTYGIPGAPDGTINGLRDVASMAVKLVRAATKANARMVFRITWQGVAFTIFNTQVSGGAGFTLQANQAATQDISFTPVGDVMDYDS